jgi:hypothetical protein
MIKYEPPSKGSAIPASPAGQADAAGAASQGDAAGGGDSACDPKSLLLIWQHSARETVESRKLMLMFDGSMCDVWRAAAPGSWGQLLVVDLLNDDRLPEESCATKSVSIGAEHQVDPAAIPQALPRPLAQGCSVEESVGEFAVPVLFRAASRRRGR